MIEGLKNEPIVLNTSLLDYGFTKSIIMSMLYRPAQYATLAVGLDALVERNMTILNLFMEAFSPSDSGEKVEGEPLQGIRCSEKSARLPTLASAQQVADGMNTMSKYFGDTFEDVVFPCAKWRIPAKERYSGNFQVKTKTPILIIGNTFDPVTPMASAKNLSEALEGSVVLHHDGFGVSKWQIPVLSHFQKQNANLRSS